MNQKFAETDRKPTIKLKIYNFFWKPETDQKFAETDQKKETDQQIENL